MLVKLRLGEKKCVSLRCGLCGDASVLVPPFLGGDLWGSAGQVSDYLCSLPSNIEQTGLSGGEPYLLSTVVSQCNSD